MKKKIVKSAAITGLLIAITVPSVMEGKLNKKQEITIKNDSVMAGISNVVHAAFEDDDDYSIEQNETYNSMDSGIDCSQNNTINSSNELREENHYHGWISSNKANAMSEPNKNSVVVNTYYYNDYIYYTICNDNWIKLEYNGQDAYISINDIKDVGDIPMKYTDEDLYILSHVIMGETGIYSYESMLYVGSVVLNRVKHEKFPNTIKSVVFSKGQYACTWDGNYYTQPRKECIKAAEQLLKYGSILPENVVYQATFKQGSGVYEYFDHHYYCYY